VVTCTLVSTPWGRALVTGDRDEHVRISVFPQTWIIHAMALGHTAFVSCVSGLERGFVSGDGDNRIISWDFNGVLCAEYSIHQGSCVRILRPWREFIVVVGDGFDLMHIS
jgi:hypothetical protein